MVTYGDYMLVGIREFKAHLSAYVHRAVEGEIVTITDRGRPVAQLAPCHGDVPAMIDRGVALGRVTPRRRPGPLPPSPLRLTLPRHLTSEAVLAEDRGD